MFCVSMVAGFLKNASHVLFSVFTSVFVATTRRVPRRQGRKTVTWFTASFFAWNGKTEKKSIMGSSPTTSFAGTYACENSQNFFHVSHLHGADDFSLHRSHSYSSFAPSASSVKCQDLLFIYMYRIHLFCAQHLFSNSYVIEMKALWIVSLLCTNICGFYCRYSPIDICSAHTIINTTSISSAQTNVL